MAAESAKDPRERERRICLRRTAIIGRHCAHSKPLLQQKSYAEKKLPLPNTYQQPRGQTSNDLSQTDVSKRFPADSKSFRGHCHMSVPAR